MLELRKVHLQTLHLAEEASLLLVHPYENALFTAFGGTPVEELRAEYRLARPWFAEDEDYPPSVVAPSEKHVESGYPRTLLHGRRCVLVVL